MREVTVYWSDEVDAGPITPAIKYPPSQPALSAMQLPDFKNAPAAGVQRCPGFVSYYKNAFVYRSPVDVTITQGSDGSCSWWTSLTTQDEVDRLVEVRDLSGMVSLRDFVHMWCDEPMVIEQLNPAFIDSDFTSKCEVVPGAFDISKWFRPLQPAFRIRQTGVPTQVVIKRGDPLYIVRFLTDKKVVFKQFYATDRLRDIHAQLSRVKSSTRTFHSSLENYYEAFKMRRYKTQVTAEILRSLVE